MAESITIDSKGQIVILRNGKSLGSTGVFVKKDDDDQTLLRKVKEAFNMVGEDADDKKARSHAGVLRGKLNPIEKKGSDRLPPGKIRRAEPAASRPVDDEPREANTPKFDKIDNKWFEIEVSSAVNPNSDKVVDLAYKAGSELAKLPRANPALASHGILKLFEEMYKKPHFRLYLDSAAIMHGKEYPQLLTLVDFLSKSSSKEPEIRVYDAMKFYMEYYMFTFVAPYKEAKSYNEEVSQLISVSKNPKEFSNISYSDMFVAGLLYLRRYGGDSKDITNWKAPKIEGREEKPDKRTDAVQPPVVRPEPARDVKPPQAPEKARVDIW